MVNSENCDINCDSKKKIRSFGLGFILMFISLSIVAVISIVLVIQKLKSCNCLKGSSYYTIPIGLLIMTILLTVVMALIMIFWSNNKDDKDKKESSSYSSIEILAIIIIIILSLGINILSSIFGLTSQTRNSNDSNELFSSTNSNRLTDFLTDYIYLLLPNLDYIQPINISSSSTPPVGTSISSSSTPSVGTNISSSFSQFLLKTINESKNKIFKAKK